MYKRPQDVLSVHEFNLLIQQQNALFQENLVRRQNEEALYNV